MTCAFGRGPPPTSGPRPGYPSTTPRHGSGARRSRHPTGTTWPGSSRTRVEWSGSRTAGPPSSSSGAGEPAGSVARVQAVHPSVGVAGVARLRARTAAGALASRARAPGRRLGLRGQLGLRRVEAQVGGRQPGRAADGSAGRPEREGRAARRHHRRRRARTTRWSSVVSRDDPLPARASAFTAMLDSALPWLKRAIAAGRALRKRSAGTCSSASGLQARVGPAWWGRRSQTSRPATCVVREVREELGLKSPPAQLRLLAVGLARRPGSGGRGTRFSSSSTSAAAGGRSGARARDPQLLERRDPPRVHWVGARMQLAGRVAPYNERMLPALSPRAAPRWLPRDEHGHPSKLRRTAYVPFVGRGARQGQAGERRCQIGSRATPTKRIVR